MACEVKVYNAWTGSMPQFPSVVSCPPVRLLTSFAYDNGKIPLYERIVKHLPLEAVDLMMDSGAFSVWTRGETVDLPAYIEWAKERAALFTEPIIINLDVIPGAPGVKPTERERKRAIKQSMLNADEIRSAGLPVMEVFHLHDGSFKVMEALWERRRPGEVLGIGGLAGLGTSRTEMKVFGDQVFARVKEWCGSWQGITKVHGLGISPDSPMARSYPWWSIDSSSWTTFQRYGRIVRANGRSQKDVGWGITSVRPVSDLYYIRVVRRWKRLEETYTKLWADRGVTFAEEAVVL